MMRIPLISVIMSVYNCDRYLKEAMDSILNQSCNDFEFIIIDDASSDKTRELIKSYSDPRIRLLVNQENLGQTISLNLGITQSRGEYIARQDGDDISLPDRFEKQIRFLQANPEVTLVGTGATIINEHGQIIARGVMEERHLCLRWRLLYGNSFFHTSLMWRRGPVNNEVGEYNPQYRYANDYDFVCRVAEKFEVANLSALLLQYRRHPQAMGVDGNLKERNAAEEISSRQLEALFGCKLPVKPEWLRHIGVREPQLVPLEHVPETFQAFKMTHQLFVARHGINATNCRDDRKHIRRDLGSCIVMLLKWLFKNDIKLGLKMLKEILIWDRIFLADCLVEAVKVLKRHVVY